MKRIVACPGSVRASSSEAQSASSIFALEGTAAHELCEYVMTTRADPQDYLGGLIDLQPAGAQAIHKKSVHNPLPDAERYWRIDEEMVDGVEMYRDAISAYISPDDIVEYETRLDMSHIHPELFGTGDAVVFKPKTHHLIVGDFKYGSGLVVEVEDNEQLWTYALGFLHRFHNYGVEQITLVVIQPRAFHKDGPIRTQTIAVQQLQLFQFFITDLLDYATNDGGHFKAGEHCRFCPIAYKCSVLRDYVFEIIGVRFVGDINDSAMPVLSHMTPDELGRVYREAKVVEGWFRRFFEHAHKEALNGRVPTGCKVVEKRAYRFFNDPAEAEVRLDLLGYGDDEIKTTPELKTAAQIEKVVGKKLFKSEFADVVTKRSNGFVLALEEDAREAVKLDKSDVFGAVDEDIGDAPLSARKETTRLTSQAGASFGAVEDD